MYLTSRNSDNRTLLHRFCNIFSTVTLLEFFVCEVILFSFGSTICNDTNFVKEDITKSVNIFVAGSFSVQLSLYLIRVLTGVSYSSKRNNNVAIYSALVVSILATASTLTSLISPQGICVDAFGLENFFFYL